MQLTASVSDFFDQLFSFSLRDTRIPELAHLTYSDMTSYIDDDVFSGWLIGLTVVHYVTVLAACIALGWFWRSFTAK